MNGHDQYAEWDGAYVLGALSPPEQREYEQHRDECADCAAAVAEVADLPQLLALVAAGEVEPVRGEGGVAPTAIHAGPGQLSPSESESESESEPESEPAPAPAAILAAMLGSLRRRRRTQRRVVAASILLAAVVLALLVSPIGHRSSGHPDVSLGQVVPSPLHATVRLAAESWGTKIDLTCRYDVAATASATNRDVSYEYVLSVTDRSGRTVRALDWWAKPGTTVWPTGTVGVALPDIARIQVQTMTNVALLQLDR